MPGLSSKDAAAHIPSPVWVNHTPTPDNLTDDETNSTDHASSTPPYDEKQTNDNKGKVKDRLKSFLPQSWDSFILKLKKRKDSINESDANSTEIKILPNGTRVSPPVSPLVDRRRLDNQAGSLGGSSYNSSKPLLWDSPTDNNPFHQDQQEESILTSIHPAEYYAAKLEVYQLKYSYLKSWPGLLRLLAGFELLFGGMVFACVIAYIQKDGEWSNSYGLYNGIYNNGMGVSGYSYRGPMTPFILAVAGVSWIITVILLVLGMTMYYRTILLDSSWWPLTEAFTNVALFLLYMASGVVYLNDLNRGGLCYMTIGINPIMANLCRVDGGQMAGTSFIFINMLMYLLSFLISLKMWRHETTRKDRERFGYKEEHPPSIPLGPTRAKRIAFEDDVDRCQSKEPKNQHTRVEFHGDPALQIRPVVPGHAPQMKLVADYVIKYPEISSTEEREQYKAVFNDQYQEYKDLHRDVTTALNKFRELDVMMTKLRTDGSRREERRRVQIILKKYEEKKNDPVFLEKRERYNYLKAKLNHIKNRIRSFDQDTVENTHTILNSTQYDSPPVYTPPYRTMSHDFYSPRSVHAPRSDYVPYSYNQPPDLHFLDEKPQHFYRWFSPPGFVKTFQGATVIMCFLIFACVASTLVWDMHGLGYGGYGVGATGADAGGTGSGYYGGSYGYSSAYMTPYSAKSAMISMAAINFLVSLGFLVGSFSRSSAMRGRRFYLILFTCDIILAVLQGIIDIVFVIGVNPMSQSSQSMLYNPMLMMCQNIQGSPSLSGSIGAGFPGGFPMYNQYLQHYCYMDPEETVAFVLGLMVVLALALAAYYAYKTRSKIWRHGKHNIYWDQPVVRDSQGHNIQDWVQHVGEGRSTQKAPTVVLSERVMPELRAENSVVPYDRSVSVYSEGTYSGDTYTINTSNSHGPEPLYQNTKVMASFSCFSEETDSIEKPPQQAERECRQDRERCPIGQEVFEFPCGTTTDYATAADTGNELDGDQRHNLFRLYPEITSDQQRRQYKREFDSDLAHYKILCAEMDDISDQIHKLSRELDLLEEDSMKYQGVADEYNRLKDLKRAPDYQEKKRQSKELREKLFHIKRLVKNYDQGLC
ncbi:uncharacterized protein LOC130123812 [Lampris incognitus]|uniref:uncharacterized protein LOC130123812 n=1 Tax=Lampris incognitus TaxID=2546036 RepID=UPI0024B4D958|nr:uncharacterized protein LOC130123812 [Lampris incognitus]